MNKNIILNLFDDEKYEEVYKLTNPYKKENIESYEILYFLKSKLALDNFEIKDKLEIKKLVFYYFYLLGKVEFDNNYSFSFKDNLKINFLSFDEVYKLKDFKKYFDFGKNKIFLNKIVDKSINQNITQFRDGAKEIDNIIDFFIMFTHECSELYFFSGEHFPLFKWLINEFSE